MFYTYDTTKIKDFDKGNVLICKQSVYGCNIYVENVGGGNYDTLGWSYGSVGYSTVKVTMNNKASPEGPKNFVIKCKNYGATVQSPVFNVEWINCDVTTCTSSNSIPILANINPVLNSDNAEKIWYIPVGAS